MLGGPELGLRSASLLDGCSLGRLGLIEAGGGVAQGFGRGLQPVLGAAQRSFGRFDGVSSPRTGTGCVPSLRSRPT